MSNRANLANGLLAGSMDTTQAYLDLQPGYIAAMPTPPFFVTITPFGQLPTMGNSEIVGVTSVSGNRMNLLRAQKGTVAKSFPAGSIVTNSVYADDKVDIGNISWASPVQQSIFADFPYNNGSAYGDGTPVGPSVTINVPKSGNVMVALSCGMYGSTTPKMVSFQATGANSIDPSDDNAMRSDIAGAIINGNSFLLTGLNPGETTFTVKYKGAAGARFWQRKISVFALL
jgi:gp22